MLAWMNMLESKVTHTLYTLIKLIQKDNTDTITQTIEAYFLVKLTFMIYILN